jgi:hypothetical protein
MLHEGRGCDLIVIMVHSCLFFNGLFRPIEHLINIKDKFKLPNKLDMNIYQMSNDTR